MGKITVTDTARQKSTREYKDSYLSEEQIKECLQDGGGTIYRETSPYNPEMYPDNEFIWRMYEPMRLDFAIVVEGEEIIVKTQMSHHNDEYENNQFYETVGSSITEMISSV